MSLHNDLSSPDPRAPHSSKRAVDIDDILQDLDRPEQDFDPFNGEAHLGNSGYISRQLFSGEADLQALTRAWVNEKGAGELLPYVSLLAHMSILWLHMVDSGVKLIC